MFPGGKSCRDYLVLEHGLISRKVEKKKERTQRGGGLWCIWFCGLFVA